MHNTCGTRSVRTHVHNARARHLAGKIAQQLETPAGLWQPDGIDAARERLEALELGIGSGTMAPNEAGRSLRDSTPAKPGRGKKEAWKPKPMGPGGGGWDPKKMKKRG